MIRFIENIFNLDIRDNTIQPTKMASYFYAVSGCEIWRNCNFKTVIKSSSLQSFRK